MHTLVAFAPLILTVSTVGSDVSDMTCLYLQPATFVLVSSKDFKGSNERGQPNFPAFLNITSHMDL